MKICSITNLIQAKRCLLLFVLMLCCTLDYSFGGLLDSFKSAINTAKSAVNSAVSAVTSNPVVNAVAPPPTPPPPEPTPAPTPAPATPVVQNQMSMQGSVVCPRCGYQIETGGGASIGSGTPMAGEYPPGGYQVPGIGTTYNTMNNPQSMGSPYYNMNNQQSMGAPYYNMNNQQNIGAPYYNTMNNQQSMGASYYNMNNQHGMGSPCYY
jgi:hypothetical protein